MRIVVFFLVYIVSYILGPLVNPDPGLTAFAIASALFVIALWDWVGAGIGKPPGKS